MSVPATGGGGGERLEWQRGWGGPRWKWTACLLSTPCLLSALQLILWYEALWLVGAAAPLGPTSSLPQSFLLKCLEQMRKVQADSTVLQERLVSERRGGEEGTWMLGEGQWRKEEGIATGSEEGERAEGRGREW